MIIKLSSIQWCQVFGFTGLDPQQREPEKLNDKNPVHILDPDGWDRHDYNASIDEKIDVDEFNKRIGVSTCRFLKGYWDKFDILKKELC